MIVTFDSVRPAIKVRLVSPFYVLKDLSSLTHETHLLCETTSNHCHFRVYDLSRLASVSPAEFNLIVLADRRSKRALSPCHRLESLYIAGTEARMDALQMASRLPVALYLTMQHAHHYIDTHPVLN